MSADFTLEQMATIIEAAFDWDDSDFGAPSVLEQLRAMSPESQDTYRELCAVWLQAARDRLLALGVDAGWFEIAPLAQVVCEARWASLAA